MKKIDLTEQRFGKLIALHRTSKVAGDRRRAYWTCRCDCGTFLNVETSRLRAGKTGSCGCLRSPDLTGRRFGRLKVLFRAGQYQGGQYKWRCRCDCGRVCTPTTSHLLKGRSVKCGVWCGHDPLSNKRQCPGCERMLQREDFDVCKNRRSGLQGYCKDCRRPMIAERLRRLYNTCDLARKKMLESSKRSSAHATRVLSDRHILRLLRGSTRLSSKAIREHAPNLLKAKRLHIKISRKLNKRRSA